MDRAAIVIIQVMLPVVEVCRWRGWAEVSGCAGRAGLGEVGFGVDGGRAGGRLWTGSGGQIKVAVAVDYEKRQTKQSWECIRDSGEAHSKEAHLLEVVDRPNQVHPEEGVVDVMADDEVRLLVKLVVHP